MDNGERFGVRTVCGLKLVFPEWFDHIKTVDGDPAAVRSRSSILLRARMSAIYFNQTSDLVNGFVTHRLSGQHGFLPRSCSWKDHCDPAEGSRGKRLLLVSALGHLDRVLGEAFDVLVLLQVWEDKLLKETTSGAPLPERR